MIINIKITKWAHIVGVVLYWLVTRAQGLKLDFHVIFYKFAVHRYQ